MSLHLQFGRTSQEFGISQSRFSVACSIPFLLRIPAFKKQPSALSLQATSVVQPRSVNRLRLYTLIYVRIRSYTLIYAFFWPPHPAVRPGVAATRLANLSRQPVSPACRAKAQKRKLESRSGSCRFVSIRRCCRVSPLCAFCDLCGCIAFPYVERTPSRKAGIPSFRRRTRL